ncbi:MMPL family transporter [uncultured Corynebacterium sp.]|uniref:MMPL family transporter n=1 Tax=uncultured Corynebacterium sp. TaxID=159447 RepID=UPI00259898A5|nr:MMPL family transporter [uncultured Corynebacterium sp.]
MFSTWGDIAYRFRRIIPLVIVAAIVALFAVFGTQLGDRMSQEGWDDPHSQSTRAAAVEQEVFGRDDSGDVILLVRSETPGGAVTEEVKRSISQQLDALQKEHSENLGPINSFFNNGPRQLANADGTAAFASIAMAGTGEDVLKNYRAVEDDLRNISADGVSVEVAGATAVSGALDEGMSHDIKRAELIALPAVGLLLLLVFGGVIAAGMPLLVGVLSIMGSAGVLSILAQTTQINVFAQSVVTLLGLGLAIDYGLFMVSRFREEMAEGNEVRVAVKNTTATAGKTVVFSALMVAVALSGLLIFPQAFLKSVAYGAMSAVALAAILSVAVLPSIFAILGPNIDKWAIKKQSRKRSEVVNGVWGKIPTFAMRHSKAVTLVLVAGLLALAIPLTGIKLGGLNETYLPPSETTRVAQGHFDESFPTFRTDPVKLVIQGDPSVVSQVYQQANQVEGLVAPFQVSQATKDNVTVLSAAVADRKDYGEVVNYLHDLRVDGATVMVAGTPALEVESINALFEKLPWMLLYIMLVSFVLMALIFGSLIIPAKAVIMNILGTGATLGVLTLLFVEGVGADFFNFTPGPLMSPVLVLIVAIIFGLSTDYEVFLVSRMVEARARGASTDQAIRFGTATTGSIITAAALIMIVVCGAFGFSSIVMMKYIAFGMVIALILDATIIRMLLVPAVMHMLREDNWWAPKWVKSLSEKVGHNEKLESAPAAASAKSTAASTSASSSSAPQRLTVAELAANRELRGRANRGQRAITARDTEGGALEHSRTVPFSELMKRMNDEGGAK